MKNTRNYIFFEFVIGIILLSITVSACTRRPENRTVITNKQPDYFKKNFTSSNPEKMDGSTEYRGEINDFSFFLSYPRTWRVSQSPRKIIWEMDSNGHVETMLVVEIFTDDAPQLTEDWIRQKFQIDIDRRQIKWPTIAGLTWAIFETSSGGQPASSETHAAFDRGEFQLVVTPFRQEILETFSFYHHPIQLTTEFKPWVNDHPVDTSIWKQITNKSIGLAVRFPSDWVVTETTNPSCISLNKYRTNSYSGESVSEGHLNICKWRDSNLNDFLKGIGYELTEEAVLAGKVWVYGHRADLLDIQRVNYKGLPGYLVDEIGNFRQLFVQKGGRVYEFSRIENQDEIAFVTMTILDTISFLE